MNCGELVLVWIPNFECHTAMDSPQAARLILQCGGGHRIGYASRDHDYHSKQCQGTIIDAGGMSTHRDCSV